jgi:hypothetical protein
MALKTKTLVEKQTGDLIRDGFYLFTKNYAKIIIPFAFLSILGVLAKTFILADLEWIIFDLRQSSYDYYQGLFRLLIALYLYNIINIAIKFLGYLEDNVARDESGYPLLILKEDGTITLNEDWNYEEQGYLRNNEIRYLGSDKLIFSFHKDKGEIQNYVNNKTIYMRGEGIDELDEMDFFGINAVLLEMFAGAPEGGDDESIVDIIFDDD